MKMSNKNGFLEKFFIPQKNDSKDIFIRKIITLCVTGAVIVGAIIGGVVLATSNNKGNNNSSEMSSEETSSMESEFSSEEMSSEELSSEESSDETSSDLASETVASVNSSSKNNTSSTKTSSKNTTSSTQQTSANVTMPGGFLDMFKNAYSRNKQVKAKIVLPSNGLEYYVTQTGDNAYYLDRNLDGKKDPWGNPYLDFRCRISKSGMSDNCIVYGHSNPKTGDGFQIIKSYKDIEFYKKNPTIKFTNVYGGEDTYKVVNFFVEWTKPKSGYFRYQDYINFEKESQLNTFMEEAQLRSYINTNVDYKLGDQFLTLSTCWDTNSSNYTRLILVARRVRNGESDSVDTSKATQNKDKYLNPLCKPFGVQ